MSKPKKAEPVPVIETSAMAPEPESKPIPTFKCAACGGDTPERERRMAAHPLAALCGECFEDQDA